MPGENRSKVACLALCLLAATVKQLSWRLESTSLLTTYADVLWASSRVPSPRNLGGLRDEAKSVSVETGHFLQAELEAV